MRSRRAILFFTVLLLQPFVVSAQSTDELRAQLQAEVEALLLQVGALEQELETAQSIYAPAVPTPPPSLPTLEVSSCISLSRTLGIGARGEDVSTLQRFLAADPAVYPEGIISGYFGTLTETAVERFQAKQDIVSSGSPDTNGYGLVGPRTRARIQELGCSGAIVIPEVEASGGAPRCAIIADKSSVKLGETVVISWNSANATYAIDNTTGEPTSLSGSATFYPSASATYTYSFFGRTVGTPAVCSTRVIVDIPNVFSPPSAGTLPASVEDALIAAPAAGSAPLNVNFTFRPKSGIPCASRNLTLEYGDGVSSILNTNSCAGTGIRSAFHSYFQNGTYLVRVFDNSACVGNARCASSAEIANTTITVSGLSACTAGGITLPHGTSREFYNAPTVLSGSSCIERSATRTCTDGILSGDATYQYSSCTVVAASPAPSPTLSSSFCTLDGVSVAHGTSRAFYSQSSVSGATTCTSVSQVRTCSSGSLSGSSAYDKATCTLDSNCALDGATLAHGSSTTFYFAKNVPANELCSSYGQTRTCLGGTLTGASAYQYASCTPVSSNSCALDNTVVVNGESATFYRHRTPPAGELCSAHQQTRTCSSGSLSGSSAYIYSSCENKTTCTQDGITLGHSSSTLFYKERAVDFGTTCASVSQSRTCTNGALSGSDDYQYASCSVSAPSAALRQNLANALSALEGAVVGVLEWLDSL